MSEPELPKEAQPTFVADHAVLDSLASAISSMSNGILPEQNSPEPAPATPPAVEDTSAPAPEKAPEADKPADKPAEAKVESNDDYTEAERAVIAELLEKFHASGGTDAPIPAPKQEQAGQQAEQQPVQQAQSEAQTQVIPPVNLEVPQDVAESLIVGDVAPLGQWVGGQIQAAQAQFSGNLVQHLAATLPSMVEQMVKAGLALEYALKENPLLEERQESLLGSILVERQKNPNATTANIVKQVLGKHEQDAVAASALAKFKKGVRLDGRHGTPPVGSRPNTRTGAPTAPGTSNGTPNPLALGLAAIANINPRG